jgi:hypothetical protein
MEVYNKEQADALLEEMTRGFNQDPTRSRSHLLLFWI